jgi:hypothetical protein
MKKKRTGSKPQYLIGKTWKWIKTPQKTVLIWNHRGMKQQNYQKNI